MKPTLKISLFYLILLYAGRVSARRKIPIFIPINANWEYWPLTAIIIFIVILCCIISACLQKRRNGIIHNIQEIQESNRQQMERMKNVDVESNNYPSQVYTNHTVRSEENEYSSEIRGFCLEECSHETLQNLRENSDKHIQHKIDLEMCRREGLLDSDSDDDGHGQYTIYANRNDDIIFQSKIKFINKIDISREGLFFENLPDGSEITENEKIVLKGYFPYLLYLLRNGIINHFIIADIGLTSMAISNEEYSFDVTTDELKELLLQLASGSTMEKITVAGINYSLWHHHHGISSNKEKCTSMLFVFKEKDDSHGTSNTRLFFYTNNKTFLIANANKYQSKSSLDDLAKDMIDKGF